jgi:arginine deiminase
MGAAGLFSQGGDLLIARSDLLVMGVHNLTQRKAAIHLAKVLEMRVATVDLPDSGIERGNLNLFNDLNTVLLHLDTMITKVDEDTFFTVPFLLEQDHARFVSKISPWSSYQQSRRRIDLGAIGGVQVISPRGSVRKLRTKLVDFLLQEGFHVLFSVQRGEPARDSLFSALTELRTQSCNLLAVSPRKVIAYGHNTTAIASLRRAHVDVLAIDGREMSRARGGPHCLVMPLSRG